LIAVLRFCVTAGVNGYVNDAAGSVRIRARNSVAMLLSEIAAPRREECFLDTAAVRRTMS